MTTTAFIDLRSNVPMHISIDGAVVSHGENVSVSVGAVGADSAFGYGNDLAADRQSILDSIAAMNAGILAGTSGQSVRDSIAASNVASDLAAERAGVLGDLSAIREEIMRSVNENAYVFGGISHDQMQRIVEAQMYASHNWGTFDPTTAAGRSWLDATMSSAIGPATLTPGGL